jgi:hypothetical protein
MYLVMPENWDLTWTCSSFYRGPTVCAEANKRSKQLLKEHFQELEDGREDRSSGSEDSGDEEQQVALHAPGNTRSLLAC